MKSKNKTKKELAQELQSLALLAEGIAHDFNNLLTAIICNISIAKMDANPKSEIFNVLSEAEKAALEAKNLAQQLFTFAKIGTPIKKSVSISELLKGPIRLTTKGSNLPTEFLIPDDLWPVEIDADQITQVIKHFVHNAEKSMPEGEQVKLLAENLKVVRENNLPLKNGNYVKITIPDKEIGIAEERLSKIFDPEFIHKQKGSDLELALCSLIIKNHGGLITGESALGAGTTFSLYLPAASGQARITEEEKVIHEATKPTKNKRKILIVDDEERVRLGTERMLKYLGYDVELAHDGAKAIELYKRAKEMGHPFDVVIMDLIIPGGLGGKETMQELLKIDPKVKAIVSSGYLTDPVMGNFTQYGFSDIIAKPYKISDLNKILSKVL
jgi:CheY-like chemotaxis protein